MLGKQHIVPCLHALDASYQTAEPDEAERFAKLAIIELCGWIEEAMDEIVRKCCQRHLKIQTNIDYCNREILERTYGFDYQTNFRYMLVRLVGLVGVERIENEVDPAKHHVLKSTLGNLRIVRNRVAHTHLRGATATLDAPSLTIRNFDRVYEGLLDFYRTMRRGGW